MVEAVKHDGFPIRVVSRRTGLSPHVIRAWERRYHVIQPHRSDTNRRLYSSADIEKLNLLMAAISTGHTIGQLARLPVEELRRLVENAPSARSGEEASPRSQVSASSGYVERCMEAVRLLDERTFEAELGRASVALGHVGLMQKVIGPMLDRIGELWRAGDLRVAHEHMASAVVRSMLGSLRDAFESVESTARIIVTTPVGDLHEFGALLAANTAGSEGWRVTYLGPNLPALEIAGAALDTGAKVVALSLIYPLNDARVSAELKELRKLLGNEITILAGGRASASYSDVLQDIGAIRVDGLGAFRSALSNIR
jgi:methanogenic corrinoid protein MtbC1